MSLLENLPAVQPDLNGVLPVSVGTLVEFYDTHWIVVALPTLKRSVASQGLNLVTFRQPLTGETQSLAYSQCASMWHRGDFRILNDGEEELSECKNRVSRVPFELYSTEQQQAMELSEYYCIAFHGEILAGRLTIGAVKKIEKWIDDTLPLFPFSDNTEHKSRGTIIRNYKAWTASGQNICSLANGNAFGTHESPLSDIGFIIYDVIWNVLLPHPNIGLKNARHMIATEITRRIRNGELPSRTLPPSLSTISDYRRKLRRYVAALVQDGSDKADRDHQPRGKLVMPWRPHVRWEVDHTLLPVSVGIEVTDQSGHTSIVIVGQVWLTVVIDVSTRYCIAVLFGIDPPSAIRTMAALKLAMCPKAELFSNIPRLKNRYDVAHIPVGCGVDNGKDLPANSKDVQALLRDLNIEAELAGVRRGDHKAIVENFNGRIKAFFRLYPGAQEPRRPKFEPKDQRKKNKKPLSIEKVAEMGWRYVMDVYNIEPQAGLHDSSPQELMQRGEARVMTERAQGKPLRIRSIMTKSPDEIDRLFTKRLTLRVTNNGVRHKGLYWNSGRLAECLGRDVQVRLNEENLGKVWTYDTKEGWFQVGSVHPHYTEGLSLFIHRRIRKRLRERHGNGKFDMNKYLENKAQLLLEFFEIAGEADVISGVGSGRRELQLGTRTLGRALDFRLAESRRFALDIKENRAPPGWGKTLELKKAEDGTHYAESYDEPTKGTKTPFPVFEYDDDDDDDDNMMENPLSTEKSE